MLISKENREEVLGIDEDIQDLLLYDMKNTERGEVKWPTIKQTLKQENS